LYLNYKEIESIAFEFFEVKNEGGKERRMVALEEEKMNCGTKNKY
jgi:hypothetical protein